MEKRMRLILLAVMTTWTFCFASSSIDNRIEEIDRQIKELVEMKRGYESKALRAENQADRLQFEDHFVLETRRYYQIAENNREKAAKIQEEIDRLEKEKEELLKKSSGKKL